MKNLETVLREGNSTVNQQIKSDFISKHVYCNVNQMVEYILNKGFEDAEAPFSFEDVVNFYIYPELSGEYVNFEGGTEEDREEEKERLENMLSEQEDTAKDAVILQELEELEELEQELQEVYEWYAVSGYLAEKLKKSGHPIIEGENIWGRCTTGQAILLDYSITQICADIKILDGQKCSWAK